MSVGEDFAELIEAGGVNDTKFGVLAMSTEHEGSSDLKGAVIIDAGIIDGKPFEAVDSLRLVGC
jgi:hypothetical protein